MSDIGELASIPAGQLLRRRVLRRLSLRERNGPFAERKATLIGILLPALLIGLWSYAPTWQYLIQTWNSDPDYSHGYLVIPVAMLLAVMRRRELAWDCQPHVLSGGALLLAAAVGRLAAARLYFLELDAWSLPVWIAGIVALVGGPRLLRATWPMMAFLLFMAPLPESVERLLSLPLQRLAADNSAFLLRSLGQPALAEGTTILLGDRILEVESACSGLRMFFSTVAMAVALVLAIRCPRLSGTMLVLAAAPIALVANTIRIVGTALVYHLFPDASDAQVHDWAGYLTLLVIAALYGFVLHVSLLAMHWHRNRPDKLYSAISVAPIFVAPLVLFVWVWQDHQTERLLHRLMDTASQLEGEGRWASAAGHWQRYVQLRPDDAEAHRRFALALDAIGPHPSIRLRTFRVLATACRLNPNDAQLQRRRLEIAHALQRYEDVMRLAERILEKVPADTSKKEWSALRRLACGRRAAAMYQLLQTHPERAGFTWPDVVAALQQAAAAEPNRAEHVLNYARLLRARIEHPPAQKRAEQADQLMDQLVQRLPDEPGAWLARYLYRRQFHWLQQSDVDTAAAMDRDLEHALQLTLLHGKPAYPEVFLAAGQRRMELGDFTAARDYYRQAIESDPNDVRPYVALSHMTWAEGTESARGEAVRILQDAIQRTGTADLSVIAVLVHHLVELGRHADAQSVLHMAHAAVRRLPANMAYDYRLQLAQVEAYVRARQHAYGAAADVLARAIEPSRVSAVPETGELVAQAWAALGFYAYLDQDTSRARRAFEQASSHDPKWSGRYEQLAQHEPDTYRGIIWPWQSSSREEHIDRSALYLARQQLYQQLMLPAASRDWKPFLRFLEMARATSTPGDTGIILLEANWLFAGGRTNEAIQLLERSGASVSHPAPLEQAIALVHWKSGDVEAALDAARRLQQLPDAQSAGALLGWRILSQQGDETAAHRWLQQAAAQRFDARLAVSVHLIEARHAFLHDRTEEAHAALESALSVADQDKGLIEPVAQMAGHQNDVSILHECERRLRRIEGSDGRVWKALRVGRLLDAVSRDSTAASHSLRQEVQQRIRELEMHHPAWRETHWLAARLARREGHPGQAVVHYERAWQLGHPDILLAAEILDALADTALSNDADHYASRARESASAAGHLAAGLITELVQQDPEEAVLQARMAAKTNRSADAQLRLAHALELSAAADAPDERRRLDLAEQAFQRAVDQNPADPRTWLAYARFLVYTRHKLIEASEVIERAKASDYLSDPDRAPLLARLYESVGSVPQAAIYYHQALKSVEGQPTPYQLAVYRHAARFFRTTDPHITQDCCRNALALDPDAWDCRRVLAQSLLEDGSVTAAGETLECLQPLISPANSADTDLRLYALALWRAEDRTIVSSTRGSRSENAKISKAIESMRAVSRPDVRDELFLGWLYWVNDQRDTARKHLDAALQKAASQPATVAAFLSEYQTRLAADPQLGDWLARAYRVLEEHEETQLASLELQWRRLADSVIQQRSTESDIQTPRPDAMLAGLEPFIQRVTARNDSLAVKQRLAERLCILLGQRGLTDRLLPVLTRTSDFLPPADAAAALAAGLSRLAPDVQIPAEVEQYLQRQLREHPDHVPLVFAVANLRYMQSQHEEAVQGYRRCLKAHPQHILVLNNLAIALAEQDPQSDEALETIKAAIQQAGRQPVLLDTLGTILVLRGQPGEATNVLQEALTRADFPRIVYLHLAKAWFDLGQHAAARLTFALAEGPTEMPRTMSPLDRQLVQQLHESLERG